MPKRWTGRGPGDVAPGLDPADFAAYPAPAPPGRRVTAGKIQGDGTMQIPGISAHRASRRRAARPSVDAMESRQLLAVAIATYPVATVYPSSTALQSITPGPDGALWFVDAQ